MRSASIAAMAPRSWEDMRTSIEARLVRQTGHDVGWWNAKVAEQPGLDDESALRRWLGDQGVTGYQQMLLVHERFGYPDFLLTSSDELIEAPGGRLLDGSKTAGGSVNLRVALSSVDDLDDEVAGLLRRAYDANV
jgi:hypothetical protein